MLDRRRVLTGMGGALILVAPGLTPRWGLSQERAPLAAGLPSGVYDTAVLDALPAKSRWSSLPTARPTTRRQPRISRGR